MTEEEAAREDIMRNIEAKMLEDWWQEVVLNDTTWSPIGIVRG